MTNQFSKTAAFLYAIALLLSSQLHAEDYYINTNGSDSNTGLSDKYAWATTAKVSSQDFLAGDRILFRRGMSFEGPLDISNERGTSKHPITVMAYGPERKGAVLKDGIQFDLAAGIVISSLELTGKGASCESSGSKQDPTFSYYRFDDLYIHDSAGGISFWMNGSSPAVFDDIVIKNCKKRGQTHLFLAMRKSRYAQCSGYLSGTSAITREYGGKVARFLPTALVQEQDRLHFHGRFFGGQVQSDNSGTLTK